MPPLPSLYVATLACNMSDDGAINKGEFAGKNGSETSVRSVNSDLETVPSNRKRRGSKTSSVGSNIASSKEGSNRPSELAMAQQKMYGWQPILTPYNVLPVLFILGLIFVPLGAVFLSASFGVTEYTIDYTDCQSDQSDKNCLKTIDIKGPIKAPVFVYFKLTNYYQNNRLYAKSFSPEQLKGEALTVEQLKNACDPLVGDGTKPYYPCGLIANSYFSDTIKTLGDGKNTLDISSSGIAWPADKNLYGNSNYKPGEVLPPPTWLEFSDDMKAQFGIKDGVYERLPDLANNERFINWMKVAGFPTFRKLYGRIDTEIPAGTYTFNIYSRYDVQRFGGTKSIVLSTTTWAGGKNSALGWSFVIIGGILLSLGIFFLILFMMSPRKVGDVTYLSWYNENLGDIIEEEQ